MTKNTGGIRTRSRCCTLLKWTHPSFWLFEKNCWFPNLQIIKGHLTFTWEAIRTHTVIPKEWAFLESPVWAACGSRCSGNGLRPHEGLGIQAEQLSLKRRRIWRQYNLVKLMEKAQNTHTHTHTHTHAALKMICGRLDKLKIKNGNPSESLEASSLASPGPFL